jgi:hypothetical protein
MNNFSNRKEALMGDRYLQKIKAFIRSPGLQQERMEDLLRRIKVNLPALEEWLTEAEDHWSEEDGVYRFYHQSMKVFDRLQPLTKEGFQLIVKIGGETDPPNEWYCQIYQEGTERGFDESVNERWLECTRPILEAFWHTKYFIQMMLKYGKELESAPQCLPSGWAAVLYLFELR